MRQELSGHASPDTGFGTPPRLGRAGRAACLAIAAWLVAAPAARADEPAVEFWPEVDVWWRVSPAWRLSLFVPISKNIETHYREGNLIFQVDYAWGNTRHLRRVRLIEENRAQDLRALMVRGGYLGGRSLGDRGEEYTERQAFGELHLRTPLQHDLLVTNRLRADLRWLGDNADFSTRWRYRLQVERDIQGRRASFVPYGNVEFYFDSRYETVNRIRAVGGTSVAWSPRFAIEGNWTYQHDTRSSVTNLNALNLILHIYFESNRAASSRARLSSR